MGVRLNISDASLLIQRGYGNIKAAQALAQYESPSCTPHETSWLKRERDDYFFRAFRNLGEMSAILLPRKVGEMDIDYVHHKKSCELIAKAMELGRLFIIPSENIKRRRELFTQMEVGLKAFQGADIDLFKNFIHEFSVYVTRDMTR